jgi:hypothetical protein
VNLTGNFREDTDNVKIGLLAGYSDGTITNSIVNISNTGSVRSDGASANVGGALGDYQDSSGVEVFSNIEVNIDGEVKAEGGGGRIGGVVAESFGPGCIMDNIDVTISGTGKVEANDTTGTSPFLGGMIGINTGIIRNSSLIIEPGGKVTTTGGIVAIGGMAGYNDYHIESTNTVLIQGSILGGPSSPIGGYVGFSYNSSVSDGQVTVAATGIIQASDGTRIGGMYGASSGTVRGQITNFGTIKATSGSPIMGGFIGTLLTGGVVQSGTMILSSSGRIETDYTGVTTSKIGGFAGHTETGSIISSGSSDLSGTIYDSTNSFGSIGGFIGFHEGLITMANLDLRLGGVILIDNGSGDYGWLIGLFNQTGGASYVHNLGVATGNLQVNTIPQNSTNLVGDTW